MKNTTDCRLLLLAFYATTTTENTTRDTKTTLMVFEREKKRDGERDPLRARAR